VSRGNDVTRDGGDFGGAGAAGRGTLVSARVGCFIASISNIILHTRLREREREREREINNINSGIP